MSPAGAIPGPGPPLCYQLDASDDGAKLQVDRLLVILNANFESQWVKLPPLPAGRGWYGSIDTSLGAGADFAATGQEIRIDPHDHYIASARSTVALLSRSTDAGTRRRLAPDAHFAGRGTMRRMKGHSSAGVRQDLRFRQVFP